MSDLYDLPDGWEWKSLKNISKFENGDRGKNYPSKSAFVDSGIAVISATNLDGWNIDVTGLNYITEDRYNLIGSGKIRKDDILFCLRGSLGKCGLVTNFDKGVIASSLVIVRPSEDLNTKLLMYYFNSELVKSFINKYNNGAAQPNLSAKNLSLFEFPLPPLSEQQRIVSKLDNLFEKIDKAISLHQKNMDEADVFMGSVLNDVFGELEEKYQVELLGNLTKTTSGGTPKRNEKSYWGGNIGWLKSGELNDGYITEVEEFITEDGLNKSSAKLFPIGTLLIAMYGATVGRLGILEIETTTNQAVCGILNDKNQFETLYMFYFLKKIREKMLKDSFGGAQPNISQTYIKELEVPLPPLQIQQKVVKYLDEVSNKIEKVKSIQKEKMDSLKALKASILDQAFRGEL